MKFIETPLKGSFLVLLNKLEDDRGWFARTYCKKEFGEIGHNNEWVQTNQSFTKFKGSIRGMHYQLPPHGETKLIRCLTGKVWDLIVDLRKNSRTFLKWYGVELSEENGKMLYIPAGFAHGFQTMTNGVNMLYQHTAFFESDYEAGLRYNDPRLQIQWPLPTTQISERDNNHPLINQQFTGI